MGNLQTDGRIFDPQDRLFEILNELLFLSQAVAVSLSYFSTGSAVFNPGDYLTAECAHLDREVRLPLFGPIQSRLSNKGVVSIEINIVPKKKTARQYNHYISTNREIMAIITPFFTKFFEDHARWVSSNVEGDKSKWPEPWGFARLVRNAMSHGGALNIDNIKAPVMTWRGLSYGPNENGRLIIGTDLSFADIMILMFDMSDDLTEHGCPFPLP